MADQERDSFFAECRCVGEFYATEYEGQRYVICAGSIYRAAGMPLPREFPTWVMIELISTISGPIRVARPEHVTLGLCSCGQISAYGLLRALDVPSGRYTLTVKELPDE